MKDRDNKIPRDTIAVNIKNYIDFSVNALRDILESRVSEINHKLEYKAEVSQIAIKEAKSDLNIRLEAMNKFREAMGDLTANFVTRNELEIIKDQIKNHISRGEHDVLCSRVDSLSFKVSECATKNELNSLKNQQIGFFIAIIILLLTTVFALLKGY